MHIGLLSNLLVSFIKKNNTHDVVKFINTLSYDDTKLHKKSIVIISLFSLKDTFDNYKAYNIDNTD